MNVPGSVCWSLLVFDLRIIYLSGWEKVNLVLLELCWKGGTSKNMNDPQNLLPSYKFYAILGWWSKTVVESCAPGIRNAKTPLLMIYCVPFCVANYSRRLLKI